MNVEQIRIDKLIFEKDVILSTCSLFLSEAYFKISYEDEYFSITIELMNSTKYTISELIKSFYNELILQQRKKDVATKFDDIKSIIIDAAFSPIKK